jgi:putative phosphonate metabolism protein
VSDAKDLRPRFAVYWIPDGPAGLVAFAEAWLGRDRATAEPRPRPAIPGLSEARLADITREPSVYGFHATLKPPFRLVDGAGFERLAQTCRAFTASRRPVRLPALELKAFSGFLALTTRDTCQALHALADDCVRVFDAFRAAEDGAELARRRHPGLSPRQDELLQRWGYPYVLDEWRFHLTLTSRLDDGEREQVAALLAPMLAPLLGRPPTVSAICLVRQEHPLAPFRLVERYSFGG